MGRPVHRHASQQHVGERSSAEQRGLRLPRRRRRERPSLFEHCAPRRKDRHGQGTVYGDAFVAHLDGNTGAATWAKAYGGTDVEYPASLALDRWDEIFLVGAYRSPNFSLGATSLPAPPAGTSGTYVLKLDPNGNVYWGYGAVAQGDASASELDLTEENAIAVDPSSGAVSIAMWTSSGTTVDFGDGKPNTATALGTVVVHRAP